MDYRNIYQVVTLTLTIVCTLSHSLMCGGGGGVFCSRHTVLTIETTYIISDKIALCFHCSLSRCTKSVSQLLSEMYRGVQLDVTSEIDVGYMLVHR